VNKFSSYLYHHYLFGSKKSSNTMAPPFGSVLLWSSLAAVSVSTAPMLVAGQLRRSAERIRSAQDIYPAQQLWYEAQARTRSTENDLERRKEQMEAELAKEQQLIQIMEDMGGSSFFFSMETEIPSSIPSDGPSFMPSTVPNDDPSLRPTTSPSERPSFVDSLDPTISEWPSHVFWPSFSPTVSLIPSFAPSQSALPSAQQSVSLVPSVSPSLSTSPSSEPSISIEPSEDGATKAPTVFPSGDPTDVPTKTPTKAPTQSLDTAAPTGEPSSNPTIHSDTSSTPTLSNCPGFTPEERVAAILQILFEVADDPALLRDLDSPQGQATDWLINGDLEQTCPNDEKLVQRWTLAVMYYSTSGDEWERCSAMGADPCGTENPFLGERRFLSSFDECEWAGIACNTENCVTEVVFEDNNLIGTIPTGECAERTVVK
jgi:hypothetical protein